MLKLIICTIILNSVSCKPTEMYFNASVRIPVEKCVFTSKSIKTSSDNCDRNLKSQIPKQPTFAATLYYHRNT